MRYRTSAALQSVPISFDVGQGVPESDIKWFLRFMEDAMESGARFKAGETIQIGWIIDRFEQQSESEIAICEPDFTNIPIAFRDSVTITLRHLRLHKDVVESVGLQPAFPSIRQSAIVCSSFADEPVIMVRNEPLSDTDSGVFVGCGDIRHDHETTENLERRSLYEVALLAKSVIPFVALPVGSEVHLAPGLEVFFEGKLRPIRRGSYLAEFARG